MLLLLAYGAALSQVFNAILHVVLCVAVAIARGPAVRTERKIEMSISGAPLDVSAWLWLRARFSRGGSQGTQMAEGRELRAREEHYRRLYAPLSGVFESVLENSPG